MKWLIETWEAFLNKIYEAKALSDLEALVNDEDYCERLERETAEPEWQPYPVGQERKEL